MDPSFLFAQAAAESNSNRVQMLITLKLLKKADILVPKKWF